MKKWSSSWKASKKAKKQRKYRYNAPLHIKRKFANSHLSKELIQKYNKRSMVVIKGDKVKVGRGQFKGHIGKVDSVNTRKSKVLISGIEIQKKDGSKALPYIAASNITITELNLEDKRRSKILERKKARKE